MDISGWQLDKLSSHLQLRIFVIFNVFHIKIDNLFVTILVSFATNVRHRLFALQLYSLMESELLHLLVTLQYYISLLMLFSLLTYQFSTYSGETEVFVISK